MTRPTCAAVILAAGASRRMGRPKALLPWAGRPLLAHLLDRARGAGLAPRVVVSGACPLRPLVAARGESDLACLRHPGWADGPFSSLRAGLDALPPGRHVMVLTVDRPHLRIETLADLLSAAARDPSAILQPSLAGRRGHPVLLPPDVVAAIRAWDPAATLRDVLRAPPFAPRRRQVPTQDPAVLDNLDRPEDLAHLPDP